VRGTTGYTLLILLGASLTGCASEWIEYSPASVELREVSPGSVSFSLSISATAGQDTQVWLDPPSEWEMALAVVPGGGEVTVPVVLPAQPVEVLEGVIPFEYARSGRADAASVDARSFEIPFSLTFACDEDGDDSIAVACGGRDCDDADPSVHPGAIEECDGLDSDCSGASPAEVDADGDGYLACADCDDEAADAYPGAPDACDGVDSDCDGDPEEDADGDGFRSCEECDDLTATTFPGAPETCDGVDSACDGLGDEVDIDVDGFPACADCDDLDLRTHPAADERCGGADEDCDGETDEGFVFVPGDYPSIAAAQADGSGPICLTAPDWIEAISVTGGESLDLHGAGRDRTTLSALTVDDLPIDVSGGSSLTLTGVTVLGGACTYSFCSTTMASTGSTVGLTDVRFAGGSGVWVSWFVHSAVTLDRVEISDNVGVAFRIDGGQLSVSGLSVQRNYAPTDGQGGATFLVQDASASISDLWMELTARAGGLTVNASTLELERAWFVVSEGLSTALALDQATQATVEGFVVLPDNSPGARMGGALVAVRGATASIRHHAAVGLAATDSSPFRIRSKAEVSFANSLIVGVQGGPALEIDGGTAAFATSVFWDNDSPLAEEGPEPTESEGNFFWDPQIAALDIGALQPVLPSPDGPASDAGAGAADPDGTPPTLGAFGGPLAASWDLDQDGYPARWLAETYTDAHRVAGVDCDDFDASKTPVTGCEDAD